MNLILNYGTSITATLLAVPKRVLCKRILLRNIAEPLLKNQVDHNYPSDSVFELLQRIDYVDFHRNWIKLFESKDIKLNYLLNDSSHSNVSTNSYEELVTLLIDDNPINYNNEEMDLIYKNHKFEYQQINIADQIITTGSDRTKTFNEIKSRLDFNNKTVLDIGCAYGFFSFESEKLNTKKVVGTELKQHRFVGSNIIKQLSGSKCDFKFNNIFTDQNKEKFDIIYLLNVIHHLPDPINALKIAASLVNEVLVLEFPTLSDEKFLSTLSDSSMTINETLPLIGVSLMDSQDQTFVFNKSAIERILIENNNLFNKIDFIQSPISKSRLLAFCYK